MHNVSPISTKWNRNLIQLVRSVERDLVICTPFVSADGIAAILDNTPLAFSQAGRITFLTNLSVSNVASLVTDPRSLKNLHERYAQTAVHHLPGLHAKVYIADGARAIVTSGNLTAGGLYRNLEYGIELCEESLVKWIRHELLDFLQLGVLVPAEELAIYCVAVERMRSQLEKENQAFRGKLRKAYKTALGELEDRLIRLRLAGGPIHTVFAHTIEFLLKLHGPLATVELHPLIQSIHPDLCDDSVDRVIDGRAYGKKWKHAVRSAQQQLKSSGRAEYESGRWRLVRST